MALLIAGSAAAQPTPETQGAAGAEAAAVALAEAQHTWDWHTAFRLMNPEDVGVAAASIRAYVEETHDALVDSVALAASGDIVDIRRSSPYALRVARRLDAVLASEDSLSDIEVLTRVARAASSTSSWRFTSTPTVRVLGSITEGDSLVHVVVRAEWTPTGGPMQEWVDVMSMRRVAGRWTMAPDSQGGGLVMQLDRMIQDWNSLLLFIAQDETVRLTDAGSNTSEAPVNLIGDDE